MMLEHGLELESLDGKKDDVERACDLARDDEFGKHGRIAMRVGDPQSGLAQLRRPR